MYSRTDDGGIEMQILGAAGSTSNANSRLSTTGGFAGIDAQSARRAPNSSNEISQANSAMSFECGGDQLTSTIDLKVDVHRKNSSESSDSLTEQCSGGIDQNGNKKASHLSSSVQTQNAEVCQTVDYRRKSMKTKSKSEDASATTTNIIKEGGIGSDLMTRSEERRDKFVDMENSGGNRCESHKRRMRWKLQRQASQSVATCQPSLVPNTNTENELNFRRSTSSRLQRHRSSDSNDERRRHHRSHHHGLFNPGSTLQSMPTEMIYMNSSMSAIQLPTASMSSGSSTKQPTDPVDKLNSESESDDDDGDDEERDDDRNGDDKFKNSENGVYTVFEFRKRCIHRFRGEKQQSVADTAYTDFDDEMGAVGGAQPSTSSTATTATTTTTNTKSEDSGCPSSDCEQASASSKDMLLSREQKPVPSDRHSGEFVYMEPIVSSATEASAKTEDDDNDGDDNDGDDNGVKAIFAPIPTKRQSEESKGAIPKTHLCHYDHAEESTSAAAVAATEASGALMVSGTNESENQKKKSLRRSFSSLSIRSGCDPMAVEVFRQLYEEMLDEERQTSQLVVI